jgi:hypothetical protein
MGYWALTTSGLAQGLGISSATLTSVCVFPLILHGSSAWGAVGGPLQRGSSDAFA